MIINYSAITDDIILKRFKNDILAELSCNASICTIEALKGYSTSKEFQEWAKASIEVFDSVMEDNKIIDTEKLGRISEYRIEKYFNYYKSRQLEETYAQNNPDLIHF